jgi:hypothetical protein
MRLTKIAPQVTGGTGLGAKLEPLPRVGSCRDHEQSYLVWLPPGGHSYVCDAGVSDYELGLTTLLNIAYFVARLR